MKHDHVGRGIRRALKETLMRKKLKEELNTVRRKRINILIVMQTEGLHKKVHNREKRDIGERKREREKERERERERQRDNRTDRQTDRNTAEVRTKEKEKLENRRKDGK